MAELTENVTVEQATQGLEEENTVTLSKAELDALLQKEGDRRVSSALKKQEQKQREAERLKGMSEAERYEIELRERERILEEKERELTLAENKNACLQILAEKGLDPTFVDYCVSDSAEVMNSNINAIEKAFKRSVKAEVERRLGSPTPKKAIAPAELTKADLKKLSLKELQELSQTEPETYASLFR